MKKNGTCDLLMPGRLLERCRKIVFFTFFLFFLTFPMLASAYAQLRKVSFEVQNVNLAEIIAILEKSTNYTFLYQDEQVERVKNLTFHFVDEKLSDVLEKCLAGTDLDYSIVDQTVVLRLKDTKPQEQPQVNSHKVSGVVTDKNGTPLPGVTVMLKGTTTGVATDMDRRFVLEIPQAEQMVLVCSFVGMETREVTWQGEKELTVVLTEKIAEMDEVVVTGIYERKSESFTGSATTFKSEELKRIGGQNVLQSLKTLDPSFTIMESRDYGSDPNRLPDIEIRGKSSVIGLKEEFGTDPNQPLFILDGFETDLKTVVDMNMDRVASVTILKDAASTAIYGSKAANGVVVIETKKPEPGKFRVTYSGNLYISVPDLSDYNLMNAEEKLEFEQKAGRYVSAMGNPDEQLFLDSLYNINRAEIARGVNTYWLGEPVRTAVTHKHNIYAEGGDEAIRYGLGFTYNRTNGVMEQSWNELIGANFDLTYRKGIASISNKMSYDYYKQEDPIVSFADFAKANPYYRKDAGNGKIERYLIDMDTYSGVYRVENPIYNATLNSFNLSERSKFDNKLNAELRFLPELVLRGRFGLGLSQTKSDNFISPGDPVYDNVSFDKKGEYKSGVGKSFYYDGDVTLSYGKVLGEKHQVNAVLGARMRSDEATSEENTSQGFPIGDFRRPSFSSGYLQDGKPVYGKTVSRSNSFYFNGGYSFDNRYLLDANVRMDGTSVFGTNKRYSETWAVGIAWNIHNERFMENCIWLDRLKVRASIGNPGNQNFSSYQSYTTYVFNNGNQNPFGTSMLVANFGNPDLKWQKTLDKNIGLDLTLLNNRLNVNLDYYDKLTDPLLAAVSVPSSVGSKRVMTNVGSQRTQGVSGTVKYSPVYHPEERINWTLSASFKHQKAKYEDIGNSLDQFNKENLNTSLVRYYDGGSPTALWAVRSLGINPSDGRELFLTKEGTYTFEYDTEDEVVVGNSEPKLEGVLGSTLYWKGFSFSLYFRYSLGADVFTEATYNKVENISLAGLKSNQDKRALHDRWQKPGDHAKFKGISLTETTPISSRFVLRENYIKAESISVGYDFESQAVQKLGIQSLRLQANTTDLFRISSIKEERGIEYPFARSFSFSLSAMF